MLCPVRRRWMLPLHSLMDCLVRESDGRRRVKNSNRRSVCVHADPWCISCPISQGVKGQTTSLHTKFIEVIQKRKACHFCWLAARFENSNKKMFILKILRKHMWVKWKCWLNNFEGKVMNTFVNLVVENGCISDLLFIVNAVPVMLFVFWGQLSVSIVEKGFD